MATAARDRLAETLRGDAQTAFSVELAAMADDLNLEVEGFGPVRFPVTPANARQLRGFGQAARFGRGEQTLTDPDVRDTWEIPEHLVRAEWKDATLKLILATVQEQLGLPGTAELTAGLHSLLVYEQNQHFLAHQDSEKDDSMVGTLVVTLPSSYTGGELMVSHNGESKAYRGSKTALSFVAFYADCRHEVLRVKSGYRITLTYNLLLQGDDTSRPEADDGTAAELADLLREHFSTPVPSYYDQPAADPPNRLVYLLDHEYTPRALNWQRLKGADASRVALLRAAADQAGCAAVLALADIKTTHNAYAEDDDDYRYGRRWGDDYDEDSGDDDDDDGGGDSGDSGDDPQYEIREFIDAEVALTHWTQPDGTQLEAASLSIAGTEVCASTPTGDVEPYSSEYEGYMGNWGNTLDRWYQRAAIVVWPHDQAFANRAEASPGWALDEIVAKASAGDMPGTQAAAATLAPFWDGAVRTRTAARTAAQTAAQTAQGSTVSGLFGQALRAADAVTDAETAAMLLRPFRIENLTDAHVNSFGKVAGQYGQQWTAELLRTWFGGDQPPWAYSGGQERPQWVSDWLPGLCQGLHATGSAGLAAAQRLLDLAQEWIGQEIGAALALSPPSYRDKMLGRLGQPLASVLAAASAIGAAGTRAAVAGYIRNQADAVTSLEMSALRTAPGLLRDGARGDAGFGDLAAHCAERLRTRLARPPRAPGDWSIDLPAGGCACDLCDTLRAFLRDRSQRTLEWPIAQQHRQHVHARIDAAELPVTHVTRRQGRPYTLVLTKAETLFTREREARITDETDLEWLAAHWNLGA
jgi:predicted 2-oxoglutarate/Fe(II)-dependent dioxygenase YbiX